MTIDEARTSVSDLRKSVSTGRGDNEDWHHREDAIRDEVLATIAKGRNPATMRALAKVALETNDLDFARWYA